MNIEIGWFGKSVASAIILVPIWLAIPFFSRNFHLRPDVITIWYFASLTVGCVIGMNRFGGLRFAELAPTLPVLALTLVGIFLGATANILLFQAIAGAPNPGLPVAVANSASAGAFFAAYAMGIVAPKYFDATQFSVAHGIGIFFVILGVFLLSIRS